MVGIRNLSAKYAASKEKALSPDRMKETASSDEDAAREKITRLKPSIPSLPPFSADNPFPLCMEKSKSSEIDHDRHINAFIRQVLDQAPESERRIWVRMKEAFGIR